MKSNHIKKIRETHQWYDVQESNGSFGIFVSWKDSIRVLAKSSEHACFRAQKRGYGLNKNICMYEYAEMYADWRVKLSSSTGKPKNVDYF